MGDFIKEGLFYTLIFLVLFTWFYSYDFFNTIRFTYEEKETIIKYKNYYKFNYKKFTHSNDILKVIETFNTIEQLKKYYHHLIELYIMLIINIILFVIIPFLERLISV